MERLLIVVAVAIVTYATRYAGFLLGRRTLPSAFDRFLAYVPVAAFAALLVPGLADGAGSVPARLIGAAAAALVLLRFGALWGGLVAGMAAFWVVMGAL
jgi:branched-subunit amino acid transport protein